MNDTKVKKEELTNDQQLKQKLLAILEMAKLEREMAEAKAMEPMNARVQFFMEMQKQVVEQPKEQAIADKANNNEDGGGNHPPIANGQKVKTVVNRNNSNPLLVAENTDQMDAQLQNMQPKTEPEEDDVEILDVLPAPKKNIVSKVNRGDQRQQPQDQQGKPTMHTRLHTDKKPKPYKCNVCHKRFTLEINLKRHFHKHIDEKPYKCDVCNKRITSLGNLKKHMRIHTDEKPYQCKICDKRYTWHTQMKRHQIKSKACKPPAAVVDEQRQLIEIEGKKEVYMGDLDSVCTGQEATPVVVNTNNGNNPMLVAEDTTADHAQFQVVKPRTKAGGQQCKFGALREWRRWKARNLVATARYREMERKEREEIAREMELLHARNRELRADIFAVQTGINFLKGLLPLKQPKAEPEEDLELDVMPALSPMKSMDDGGDHQQCLDDLPTSTASNLAKKQNQQQQHQAKGQKRQRHPCKECPKSFRTPYELERHNRTHTGERPFACDVCHKGFTQETHLKKHFLTHTQLAFGESVQQANDQLVVVKQTNKCQKRYPCKECPKSFGSPYELNRHNRTHTGERPFACDVCHKRFTLKIHLKNHFRTHTGERPYQCKWCNQRFAQSYSLKEHTRSHTGEKPYQCEVCSKRFSRLSNLKDHIRIHTGEKPYQCPICGECFAQYAHLTRHRCRKDPCTPTAAAERREHWHGKMEDSELE